MAGVNVLRQGTLNMGPWPFAVPAVLSQIVFAAGLIWMMFMLFAGCPQFVAMLEKGWRELIFSKATPRWQILLSRFVSLTLLFYALTLTSCMSLSLRLWWYTGESPLNVLGGAMIHTITFSSLLAIGALASTAAEGGIALTMLAPIGGLVLSQFLVSREQMLYEYVTSVVGRLMLDWVYYILPKCSELQNAASAYVRSSTIPTSWPLWTTGLFTLAMLAAAMVVLERKSF